MTFEKRLTLLIPRSDIILQRSRQSTIKPRAYLQPK